tara:strand:+ start:4313 stop:4486 length:174 start_codon:yes stop_codon:yes gene_type:complete
MTKLTPIVLAEYLVIILSAFLILSALMLALNFLWFEAAIASACGIVGIFFIEYVNKL